jgi:hypothetical protein
MALLTIYYSMNAASRWSFEAKRKNKNPLDGKEQARRYAQSKKR